MKSLRLSDLRKRSNKWFRNYGEVRYSGRTTEKQMRYFIERSFDALPKKYQRYLMPEKERQIEKALRLIMADGEYGHYNAYLALISQAKSSYKAGHGESIDVIYKIFRTMAPSVYAKYNSYIYRLGYSASQYFKENMDYTTDRNMWDITLDLPYKAQGTVYNQLYIRIAWTGHSAVLLDAKML